MTYEATSFRWKVERIEKPFAKVRQASHVADYAAEVFEGEPQEVFVAFFLDSQNQIIGYSEITRGTLDASLAHPRETFRGAILNNAASIILVHNHPSGSLTPSAEDKALTVRMIEAGEILGIDVIDSIIVDSDGGLRYYSLIQSIGLIE